MFNLSDPNKKKRMIELFKTICEECEIKNPETMLECYKNRLELGCTYSKKIENILDTMDTLIKKQEAEEDWVSLLD